MQGLLVRDGYDVGNVDGFMGLKTRQAVKAMQVKYGLPAGLLTRRPNCSRACAPDIKASRT